MPGVPTDDCHLIQGFQPLYVGIAPVSAASTSTLRKRLCGSHARGNASDSTLRLTVGCLVAEQLSITLQFVRERYHFAAGEKALSVWLEHNARVVWVGHPRPWEIERAVIESLNLPLNLQHNKAHPFHGELTRLRRGSRERARKSAGARRALET
jgi:hypothetical protein